MKKQVVLCDNCESHIAKKVCSICNKDVCENCETTIEFGIFENRLIAEKKLFSILTCGQCSTVIAEINFKKEFKEYDKKEIKDMKDKIMKVFKNISLLKGLEDEDKQTIKRKGLGSLTGGLLSTYTATKALGITTQSLKKAGFRTTMNRITKRRLKRERK